MIKKYTSLMLSIALIFNINAFGNVRVLADEEIEVWETTIGTDEESTVETKNHQEELTKILISNSQKVVDEEVVDKNARVQVEFNEESEDDNNNTEEGNESGNEDDNGNIYDTHKLSVNGGEGLLIAVIDSGINYNHRDMRLGSDIRTKYTDEEWERKINSLGYGTILSHKVPFGYNYAEDNTDLEDVAVSHGYHVGGIIAANTEEEDGVIGMCPNAQILDMQVFDKEGEGGYVSDVVRAVNDAVTLGADIINISLGSSSGFSDDEDYLQKAINEAADNGIIVICAAGNEGTSTVTDEGINPLDMKDVSTVNSPATSKNAISVACYDEKNNNMAGFSSYGPTPELVIKPEVSAPGVAVRSISSGSSDYVKSSGTSVSAPYISGLSGLIVNKIKEKELGLSGEEILNFVRSSIINTAVPLIDPKSPDGSMYSVRVQGAGVANTTYALNNNVTVDVNGKNVVELLDLNAAGSIIPIEIGLHNYGEEDITYTLSDLDIYKDYNSEDVYSMEKIKDGKITFADSIVTVKAGEDKKLTAFIDVPKTLENGVYIEGFIRLNNEEAPLCIPVLGFNGDWGSEKIIASSMICSDNYERLGLVTMKENGTYVDTYLDKYVAISPTGVFKQAVPVISKYRNIKDAKLDISDPAGNTIRSIGNYRNIKKDSYSSILSCDALSPLRVWNENAGWNGTFYDDSKGEFTTIDGEYIMTLLSRVNLKSDYQSDSWKIVVDTTLPDVAADVIKQNGEYVFSANATDDFAMYPYFVICINGEIKNINMVSECGYFDGELKYNLGSIPDNSFVEYEFMDEAGNLVYNSIVLGNGYNDTVNHEYDNIDTDSYVNRCDIYSANLKSGDCISYEHVNGSGTFDLTGVIVGDKPNKVTIEGKEATIENTYKEKVYKFTCPVDIKTGINNFRVSIDQANGLTTTKDYKNIIYNGQGPQISLETGIKNAVGVVKTALRKYKFTLNINSEFEGYDIYINGDLYGTYGDTSDMFFAAEKEKAFNITYILDDQNVHYIDVKVVDLCGNVSEEVFKVQRRIMVELVKTKENLNNTSVNYTRKWTYTGEEITPKFVIACKGVTLIEGIDYEVSYSNNVNIGAGIITVNGIGDYTGTKVYSFKIIPKKAVIKKVTSKKTKKGYNTIKIKNQEGNVRYQIKYSNKKTSGFVTLKKTKNNNYKTKKLLKKKTYYFKVRAYKTVNGATYYGKWSKIYKVRIK